MSEMLERVARAIAYEHCNRKPWTGACTKEERLAYYAAHEWKTFLPAARAVLLALRNPTEGMVDMASDLHRGP